MPFLPITPDEQKSMLATIGVQSISDLFSTIPPAIRDAADFKFSQDDTGLSEQELRSLFGNLASKNGADYTHFLGGGIYDNIIPAIVDQLTNRGEFLTCYTPYQPEISQGTLQAIFEFQTLIARITGLEVANASLYDGATACAEGVLMAQRISKNPKSHVLIASSLHPDYQSVVNTFLQCHANKATLVGWNEDGSLDIEQLKTLLETHKPYALVVGSPNYFGIVEPLDRIKQILPDDCLLVTSIADLSSVSIFEPPGLLGADIVVGEAQQLGTPMLFGGPHVGVLATKKKFLRQIPGRLCGESVDKNGRRAYALTLATREQHIRREKATSNICTNQGLIALRTTIYLSFLGKRGFEELGQMNYSLFQYLKTELQSVGIRHKFKEALHYREGVFEIPNLETRFQKALDKKIIPGIRLGRSPLNTQGELDQTLLISVHPKHRKTDIDQLVEVLADG